MSFIYGNGVPLAKTQNKGQIQVIFGPMFSGKTTELIRRLKRYQVANYRCLIVRYAKDNRYSSDAIVAHDGQALDAVSAVRLSNLMPVVDKFDVVGVDEGQFFEDAVNFAELMANNGKIVIVAALDATFKRTPFGDILKLVPIAESVVKLMAVCMSCFSDGSFTKRKTDETEYGSVRVDKYGVELIGGAEKYMSVCRECYNSGTVTKNSPYKTELNGNTYDVNRKAIIGNGKNLINSF